MTGRPLQPGLVIHRRDYRDSSLLLELFTLEEGRLPAIARGAKSGRSGRAALLQPFLPLQLGLSGRGEIKTLGRVEAEGRAFLLTGKALYCGFYLNELLMRLLQRADPHRELFGHYLRALAGLAQGERLEAWLRGFEIDLLEEIGYQMLLHLEADSGRPVVAGRRYRYVPERGPVPEEEAGGQPLIQGSTLLALYRREPLEAGAAREARSLMRRVLRVYLGDRPLHSRELFRGFTPPGA